MKKSHKSFAVCLAVLAVLGISLILATAIPFTQGGSAPVGLLIALGGLTAGAAVLARSVRPDRP